MLKDASQRELALSPKESFIVQAPAGSGKTELLTQRFLLLLDNVMQPEEILAMTFTRKAATEMRGRIISALISAKNDPPPSSSHSKKTWELAQKVLARDNENQWDLLENPHRLCIQTIDSFNSSLISKMPIRSCYGVNTEIAQQPIYIYQHAIRNLLAQFEQDEPVAHALEILLRHIDNRPEKLEILLIKLLEKRDQWLPYIQSSYDNVTLRNILESQLASITTDILNNILKSLTKKNKNELFELSKYAFDQLGYPALNKLPETNLTDRDNWLKMRNILFTKSDSWRKTFNKNIGFPQGSTDTKKRMSALVSELAENAELTNAFCELGYSPDPVFKENQWRVQLALQQVLSVAVIELRNSFKLFNQVDYTENSLSALKSINNCNSTYKYEDCYTIKHLLVDEFQDTSATQYRLLENLIKNWKKHDGNTLFLVGDPMQSIYRFREAEVGLFIRVRKFGIGEFPLKFLQLSVNFRSDPVIVEWINKHFPRIFPPYDDIATGAISYSKGYSAKTSDEIHSAVSLHSTNEQGEKIASLLKEKKLQNPNQSIAILVRSRNHLTDILPHLKQANIEWSAIGIDPLAKRPVTHDLISLTRALLDINDRIAWLAVLRAPWCGLSLADFLVISGHKSDLAIWDVLTAEPNLSTDSKIRLKRILPALKSGLDCRDRFSLRKQVESTWQLLGGPACVFTSRDLDDSEVFFGLLNKFDAQGIHPSAERLSESVATIYTTTFTETANPVQIMTVHNSKGLEFDCVIAPHLEKKVGQDKKQLMLWMERQNETGKNSFLISPLNAIGEPQDPIYEYIRHEQNARSINEQSRLLYVAITRAKKNIELIFSLDKDKTPATDSLLLRLWPALSCHPSANVKYKDSNNSLEEILERPRQILKRLPVNWINPLKESYTTNGFTNEIQYIDPTLRYTGTVIHAILKNICERGQNWWNDAKNKKNYISRQLMQIGVTPKNLNFAINKTQLAIKNMLEDSRGQWIIKQHIDAKSEFALTAFINKKPISLIIDRTFIDEENIRWIIDYKTSYDDTNKENFLLDQMNKYKKQMELYKKAIAGLDKRPIRLALYFPLMQKFCEIVS